MNNETKEFLEELKQRPDVLGVILFGSWARGNNRTDSDVDLVVILKEGYRRTVEHRNGQPFEIIYTTAIGAFEYWESHKDDAAGLWEVAKILFDKDDTVERLQQRTKEMLIVGKKPIDEFQMKQFRFDAEDQLNYVESVLANDPITANLMLTNKIFAFTELFFDIRQHWIPAPKQRVAKIKELSPEFYSLLHDFYKEPDDPKSKLAIAKKNCSRSLRRLGTVALEMRRWSMLEYPHSALRRQSPKKFEPETVRHQERSYSARSALQSI